MKAQRQRDSDGGDGWRNGNATPPMATATAIEGATAMDGVTVTAMAMAAMDGVTVLAIDIVTAT